MSGNTAEKRFLDTIRRGIAELSLNGLSLEEPFLEYFRELKRWSRGYNLTGLEDEADIALDLFIDSLLYLKVIPPPGGSARKLIDIGSGAGFPGLVLKIAREDLETTLLEPSRKKAAFLRQVASRLELRDVKVLEMRVEEFSQSREVFDFITTKALFSVYEFIIKTLPLMHKGTLLLMNKGPRYREELSEARKKLGEEAGLLFDATDALLPVSGKQRHLICITPQ